MVIVWLQFLEPEWRLRRPSLLQPDMRTWILCLALVPIMTGSSWGAELIWDSPSTNYLQLLDRSKKQQDHHIQQLADRIEASKVPSRAEAIRAVLVTAESAPVLLRDPRLHLGAAGLYRVGREIPGFASSSDFVWVIHGELPGLGLVQVFFVSTGTAKVMRLFPEPPGEWFTGTEPTMLRTNQPTSSASDARPDSRL